MKLNMKNNLLLYGLILVMVATFGLSSCSPDYETNFESKSLFIMHRDLSPIKFKIDGGSHAIPVETNIVLDNWKAQSNAEWCVVEKHSDKVVVMASSNPLYRTRIAKVTIAYGHQSYDIEVTQSGIEPILLIDGEKDGVVKETGAEGGKFAVSVNTNLAIDHVNIPEAVKWLELESISEDGNNKVLNFNVLPNYTIMHRTAEILLQSSDNYTHTGSFVVQQTERDWGELIAIPIEVKIDMLSANATEPSEGSLSALLDGAINTYYHTLWSGKSPGGKPHYLQIDLDEPIIFLAIEYHGRGGGGMAGDVKRAGIWVSETGNDVDSEWTKAGVITFDLTAEKNERFKMNEQVLYLEREYKHIRYIPEARRNADPIDPSGSNGWWYAADMFFYTFEM